MAVTYLAFLSLAREVTGEALDVGLRLSITLTLSLTAVAYKLVVALSIPQESYFTLLDKYVWLCFMMLLLVAIENATYAHVMRWFVNDNVDGVMAREYILGGMLFGTFTFFNVSM
ncbi:TPA: hypothetical protein N0F65_007055 [Lagenidium giganteum]|uniref:Uncharacterized protein n=1 Tax=Lagenidium giganteum TaxID=4803 RepID=A0AAV2YW26_9STRA|nr:TPA: hypothetical protein N0F65_007055 [Lagenidium giganteum]